MTLTEALDKHGHRQVNVICQTDNPVSQLIFDRFPGESTPETWEVTLSTLDNCKEKLATFMENN